MLLLVHGAARLLKLLVESLQTERVLGSTLSDAFAFGEFLLA